MLRKRHRHGGFSLIEIEIMIVMVSVGLAGVLLALNVGTKSGADPMIRKQMLSIGEGFLAEILAKDFDDPYGDCTPTTVPSCRNDSQANRLTDRRNYNDVSDYQGFQTTGIFRLDGTAVAGLENYDIASVAVEPATIGGIGGAAIPCGASSVLPIKRITVTVAHGAEQLPLSGFRTCHDRP